MYPPEQILPPHNLPLFSINTSEPNLYSSSRFEELHQLPFSPFYFPNSPYYNEDPIFNELTWEQLQPPFPSLTEQTAMQNPIPKQDAAALVMPQNNNNNVERKRPTKKDRHSKITTAKGPRDRRMRLSLDVARPFFDLQDVLGYDKASKTVEWLLIQSKSAIDELLQGYTALATSVSSTQSECEVVSGIEDASATTTTAAVKGGKKPPEKKAKVASPMRTRESRKEARERARKRTLERKSGAVDLEGGFWGGQLGHKDVEDQRRNYGCGDDISVITRNWNQCCIYQQQDAAPQISHMNDELSELEYCGKAWEGYNNL